MTAAKCQNAFGTGSTSMLETQRFTSDVCFFKNFCLFVLSVFFVFLFVCFSSHLQIIHFYSLFLTGAFLDDSHASPSVCIGLCYGSGGIIHARRLLRAASSDFIFSALRTTIACFTTFPKDEIFSRNRALLRAPISQLPLNGIKQGESGGGSALGTALLFLKLILKMGRYNWKVSLKSGLLLYLIFFSLCSLSVTVHAGANPCLALLPWWLYQQSFQKQISLKIIKTMIVKLLQLPSCLFCLFFCLFLTLQNYRAVL